MNLRFVNKNPYLFPGYDVFKRYKLNLQKKYEPLFLLKMFVGLNEAFIANYCNGSFYKVWESQF